MLIEQQLAAVLSHWELHELNPLGFKLQILSLRVKAESYRETLVHRSIMLFTIVYIIAFFLDAWVVQLASKCLGRRSS